MSLQDSNAIYDGFSSLALGQDAGRAPNLIAPTQAARAENLIFRGGIPTTRPALRQLSITFDNNLSYDSRGFLATTIIPGESQAIFSRDIFQGAGYYAPRGQPASIMVSAGGRLFQMKPGMGAAIVTELSLPFRNSNTVSLAYMQQADRFHIIQDGSSLPIIYDGVVARRAKLKEVPVGTFMAYGMGRLVVVNGRDIFFGDLYGSHMANDAGDSVIQFTETTFLAEGFPASIAFALGKISGMTFAPQQDSSVGDGELLVFSEGGVSNFFLSQPRDQWKDSAFQRISIINVGARGHRSITSVNGDVWFRAGDGFRSYRQARAAIQGWAHLPMSTEVRDYLDADTPELLDYCSAVTFQNRLIATCSPVSNVLTEANDPNSNCVARTYHSGLVSLDFDVLSTFDGTTHPAWDGHWSGPNIAQLVEGSFEGRHRVFAFCLDNSPGGVTNLSVCELSSEQTTDFYQINGAAPIERPIAWELVPKSMDFQTPYNEKELYAGDIWVQGVTEPVTIAVDYRPDQNPNWTPWRTLPPILPSGVCGAVTCGGCPTINAGFYPRRTIGKPPDACDSTATGRSMRRGYEFQVRLRGTGHATINKLRLTAETLIEDPKAVC